MANGVESFLAGLPPEQLAQILKLRGLDERISGAAARRNRPIQPHTSWAGGLAGGLGDILGDIGSRVEEGRARGEQQKGIDAFLAALKGGGPPPDEAFAGPSPEPIGIGPTASMADMGPSAETVSSPPIQPSSGIGPMAAGETGAGAPPWQPTLDRPPAMADMQAMGAQMAQQPRPPPSMPPGQMAPDASLPREMAINEVFDAYKAARAKAPKHGPLAQGADPLSNYYLMQSYATAARNRQR